MLRLKPRESIIAEDSESPKQNASDRYFALLWPEISSRIRSTDGQRAITASRREPFRTITSCLLLLTPGMCALTLTPPLMLRMASTPDSAVSFCAVNLARVYECWRAHDGPYIGLTRRESPVNLRRDQTFVMRPIADAAAIGARNIRHNTRDNLRVQRFGKPIASAARRLSDIPAKRAASVRK